MEQELSTGEGFINSESYKRAGVDIDAGNALVEAIKPLARATSRPGADGELGGFGGLFDLKAAGFDDPVLVAGTDGVGTKLKIAQATGRHDGIGIDLVAMCVNDLVVQGAEPLFFLDYFATGRLEGAVAEEVVASIAEGCRQAGCALIGGETAEMPGMYPAGEYDLAGFAVGAVERRELLTGAQIAPGDQLLGLASDGIHSNGFSLVRKIVEDAGLDYAAPAPFEPGRSLAEALLEPTRIYVRPCLDALRGGGLKGLSHITGGGLIDNPPRVLPAGMAVRIDTDCWPLPPVFRWLADAGGLPSTELARSFNCGIGMIAVVAPERSAALAEMFAAAGETVYSIGDVVARAEGDPAAHLEHTEAAWPG